MKSVFIAIAIMLFLTACASAPVNDGYEGLPLIEMLPGKWATSRTLCGEADTFSFSDDMKFFYIDLAKEITDDKGKPFSRHTNSFVKILNNKELHYRITDKNSRYYKELRRVRIISENRICIGPIRNRNWCGKSVIKCE